MVIPTRTSRCVGSHRKKVAMKPDKIQLKIALACGWVTFHVGLSEKLRGQSPQSKGFQEVPNYPESHDAMAEAFATLDDFDLHDVAYELEAMIGDIGWELSPRILMASPLQKAEAFLRAKGLWEDGE